LLFAGAPVHPAEYAASGGLCDSSEAGSPNIPLKFCLNFLLGHLEEKRVEHAQSAFEIKNYGTQLNVKGTFLWVTPFPASLFAVCKFDLAVRISKLVGS